MRRIPSNDIGLTAIADWDSGGNSPPLVDQLHRANVPYRTRELPTIVGAGGSAQLVFYTSPAHDRAVTVLVIPQRAEVDQFGEAYYYFEGLGEGDATAGDVDARWMDLYDQCQELADQQSWMAVSAPLDASNVAVNSIVIEAHNAVRCRVTGIVDGIVHLTPVDNPLPRPQGNAPGRRPITVWVGNMCGSYRLLTDPALAALDSAAYAERLGLTAPGIQWVPYQISSH